jgi:rod shape-determining protein MreC
MTKRKNLTTHFIGFFLLLITLYAFFQTEVGQKMTGILQSSLHPLQRGTYTFYGVLKGDRDQQIRQLLNENRRLTSEIVKYKLQEKEITALHDQFQVTDPSSNSLLPSHVIGLKSYIPGFSLPEQIVIDKGEKDGVKKGSAVIVKTMLLGKVSFVSKHTALVDLTTKKNFSLTVRTSKTNALGVLRGEGNGRMILTNVVISDKLEKDDLILSKGSVREDGLGIPPGLVVGKILSFEKKSSSLFQTAEIVNLSDITKIDTVFVILPEK